MDLPKKIIGYAVATCPTLLGLTIASFLLLFETGVNDIYQLKQRIHSGNATIRDFIINPSVLTREMLFNILFVYGTTIGCIPYFLTLAYEAKQAKENRQEYSEDAAESIAGYVNFTNSETSQLLSLTTVFLPITGVSDNPDGCARNSIRDTTGKCILLTSSCGFQKWILADDNSRTAACVRRVCKKGMVLSSDRLQCYDVNDPKLCKSRNERAYVTATGHVVCYCKHGYVQDNFGKCHMLFTRGPCRHNYIWTKNKFGDPVCSKTFCSLPLLPYKGNCVQLQRREYCKISTEGFKKKCRRRKAKYRKRWKRYEPFFQGRGRQFGTANSKDNANEHPSEMVATDSNALLLSCMPGAQRDFNWKCEEEEFLSIPIRSLLPPASPSVACPENLSPTFKGECSEQGNVRNCSAVNPWDFRCV